MIRSIWLAVFLFAATPTLAETTQVYEGAAGPSRIVMQLDGEKDVAGAYFYRRARLDIALSGQWQGQSLDLSSDVTDDHLRLTRSGADLIGTLTTAKGKALAVSLHPAAAPASLPADLPAGLDLYERLRLAGLAFVPKEAESHNGKTIRWYTEPVSGIRLFRLERGYSAPAMAAMNHALARNQWSTVSDWFQCIGSDGGPGADNDQADKPSLGANYVSYVWRSSWDCAGTAHPDFDAEGHSFDAVSGRELKLDDILPERHGQIPPENSDAWLSYRSDVFGPAVVALMKRYHRAEMAPPKTDDDCDYTDASVWDFPSWTLMQKGLWLGAVFGRAMRPCDSPDWAVIPWSALPAMGAVRR